MNSLTGRQGGRCCLILNRFKDCQGSPCTCTPHMFRPCKLNELRGAPVLVLGGHLNSSAALGSQLGQPCLSRVTPTTPSFRRTRPVGSDVQRQVQCTKVMEYCAREVFYRAGEGRAKSWAFFWNCLVSGCSHVLVLFHVSFCRMVHIGTWSWVTPKPTRH